MTGWRVGYLGAPKWLASACTKMQGQTTSATCSIAQKATEAAVIEDPMYKKEMQFVFLRRRDLIISKLQEIDGLNLKDSGEFRGISRYILYLGNFINDNTILIIFIIY